MKHIILLRHGEVCIADDKYINANEFKKWVKEYNNQKIQIGIMIYWNIFDKKT